MTDGSSPADNARGFFDLTGQTALVTGASAGLGERAARVLRAAGANVVLAARRHDRLVALADELGSSLAVRCDVTSGDDLDALVGAAYDRFKTVDVLVNNAGVGQEPPALEEDDKTFAALVAVNLTAPFALSTRLAYRWVADQRGGVILNIGSLLGQVANTSMPSAGYAASKAGLLGLTRDLAAQWGRHNIRVNALAPGFLPSDMTAGVFASEAGRRMLAKRTLLPRLGRSDDLDGALLFLASEASSFITGQVLSVDGGWTAA